MKALYILIVSLLLPGMQPVEANTTSDLNSKIIGKWAVTLPDVPVFSDIFAFSLDVREKDKAMVFDLQGADMDVRDMRFTEKNGKLLATLCIGEFLRIAIWEENGVIKGSVDTLMLGELSLAFEKIEYKMLLKN